MGMTVLRVYDPSECDAVGVPLDWERCRTCAGTTCPACGMIGSLEERAGDPSVIQCEQCSWTDRDCAFCGGHGSLKAAALAWLTTRCGARSEGGSGEEVRCNRRPHSDRWHEDVRDGKLWAGWGGGQPENYGVEPRCEDCGHPMSEGTWPDGDEPSERAVRERLRYALSALRRGEGPAVGAMLDLTPVVHYSPCDEGCRHSGEGRARPTHVTDHDDSRWLLVQDISAPAFVARDGAVPTDRQASWRPVDVRTLGWPHDLRPEKLAVLCLRCWAART